MKNPLLEKEMEWTVVTLSDKNFKINVIISRKSTYMFSISEHDCSSHIRLITQLVKNHNK